MEQTVNKSEQQEKESFYEELDEKKSHQSCCTCQTLAIFFLIILIVLASGVIYIYWQITREKSFPANLPGVSLTQLNDKLKNLKSAANTPVEMSVDESELAFLLNEGISFENFLLKDVQVSINPTNILIYGSLTKPFSSKVVITAVPEAKDGKVNFKVTNISAGNFNLPAIVAERLGENLSNSLSNKMIMLYSKITVNEVKLADKKMILSGKIK